MADETKQTEETAAPAANLQESTETATINPDVERLANIVQALSTELDSVKSQNEALQAQLAEAKTSEPQSAEPKSDADLEAIESRVRAELAKERAEIEAANAKLREQLKNVTVTSSVMNQFAKDVEPQMADFVESLIAKHVHVDDSGKQYIVDEAGSKRWSSTSPGELMGPEEFLNELRNTRAACFTKKAIVTNAMPSGKVASVPTGSTSISGNDIDLDRFQSDASYRDSLPRGVRAATYKKLGL